MDALQLGLSILLALFFIALAFQLIRFISDKYFGDVYQRLWSKVTTAIRKRD
ncbi:hypothetical protein JCM19046_2158 [Bacillus sp. JCM 19046]|nr:hypothetical protein JCM19045_40 [Bacillus sp. JCM 19045]GAF17634.1 hypothetical protein JCM19046_2158 [Bacillus sp. JCM 19046]